VPGAGSLTNGMTKVSAGYPDGGVITRKILPQPRLGFAWDVNRQPQNGGARGFGISYDRYESGLTGFGATNPPFVFQPTCSTAICRTSLPEAADFCRR